jgi:Flp pilus assembly protein CpaB
MAITAPIRPSPAAKPAVRRSLFIAGIGISILAFILVLVLGSAVTSRVTSGATQVTVVVAAHDIRHRQVIGPADLTTARIPLTAAPPAALVQSAEAVGRVAQVDVLKGQPVTSNLVATGDPAFLPIPSGWNGVSIPAGELQSVAGYISPGDEIDFVVTLSEAVFSPGVTNPRQFTKLTLHAVRVIKVGPAPDRGGQGQAVTTSLTVLATPCDAPYMAWLLANGTVRYDLVSASDYVPAPTAPDAACPVGSPPVRVSAAEVDKRFSFTK